VESHVTIIRKKIKTRYVNVAKYGQVQNNSYVAVFFLVIWFCNQVEYNGMVSIRYRLESQAGCLHIEVKRCRLTSEGG
jgi:hypothetical protein